MDRRLLAIEDIHVGPRHRKPDMAKVREIAKSIRDVGLLNTPAVCVRNDVLLEDGERSDSVPVLIYGRHRLLALQELGRQSVECIVYDVDDLQAELMEIDENLARSELSPAEEAAHIARRREIWEIRNSGGNSPENKTRGRPTEFASELASVLLSSGSAETAKREINRKLKRVDELGLDIHRIVGTSLDKGVEMDALIKMPELQRVALIDRAAAGEAVSARPAPTPKPKPIPNADQAVDALAALEVIAGGIVDARSTASADAAKTPAFAAMDSALGQFSAWPNEWKKEFLAARDVAAILKV